MSISAEHIIEALVDELAMGEVGEGVETVHLSRTGPGSLLLDYGDAGRFSLVVTRVNANGAPLCTSS